MASSLRRSFTNSAAGAGFGKAITQLFTSQFKKGSECIICLTDFKEGDRVAALPCFDTHIFKEDCMKGYIEQYRGEKLLCPVCRREFQEKDIIWKVIKDDHKTDDPFGTKSKSGVSDADLKAQQKAAEIEIVPG